MESIKDYILQQRTENIDEEIPVHTPKAKPKAVFETVVASGPDFAVRRKTPKTSMVMVVIVSKAQFYIKNESAGGAVQDLNEDNLQKFVSGIPDDGFAIQDTAGNVPNWISAIYRDAGWWGFVSPVYQK